MRIVVSFLVVIGCASSLYAEPVGDVRFLAKIDSFDAKTIHIAYGGKHYEVPRKAVAGGDLKPGAEREIALSQNEFAQMKTRQMLVESEKAKKEKALQQ
jgi:hypothetical protein